MSKEIDITHPLYNKSIVITGFRDEELQNKLKNIGVNIVSSVSKNTFIVIVSDILIGTTKINSAKKLGVTIMNIEGFRKKYKL